MIPHLVPEIEGGYPERDGEEGEEGEEGEGLVLEYSRSWMISMHSEYLFMKFLELSYGITMLHQLNSNS